MKVSISKRGTTPHETRRAWMRRAAQAGAGLGGLGLGPLASGSGVARAAVYLNEADARSQLWPGATLFNPVTLDLGETALRNLARSSETRIPQGYAPRCWMAANTTGTLGWVFLDRALGKYDMIDFAAAFTLAGAVAGMEILVYRESHGGEVRNAAWRRQFSGKTGAKQLRFGDEIRNISGATLSCQHVTEGMQRLGELVSVLKAVK